MSNTEEVVATEISVKKEVLEAISKLAEKAGNQLATNSMSAQQLAQAASNLAGVYCMLDNCGYGEGGEIGNADDVFIPTFKNPH